jgi:hypothetical protein
MAKTFDVELGEKGAPFQSKFNAYTGGKDIRNVHDLALSVEDGRVKGVLVVDEARGDSASASKDSRVYAKEIRGPVGQSETQTKINSFSKDKEITVIGVFSTVSNGEYFGVILYTKQGGDAEADAAAATEPAEAEPVAEAAPVA